MSETVEQSHWSKAPLVAMVGAVALAIGLFLLIPFTQWLHSEDVASVDVRQVVTIQPPASEAPPPPEETSSEEEPPPPEFEHAFETLAITQLDLALKPGIRDAMTMDSDLNNMTVQVDIASEIEQVFTFADLPEAPRLVVPPRIRFPKALINRGIRQGEVVLLVLIDEEGRVEVKRVISSSHPELEAEAVNVARRARFSPPEIDGKRVRVQGEWPLNMQAP